MRSQRTEDNTVSSEGLIGLIAALTGLVGAVFAGVVALRKERYTGVRVEVAELYAYREAWIWATRTIASLLAKLGIFNVEGVNASDVQREMLEHQEAIDKAASSEESGAKSG